MDAEKLDVETDAARGQLHSQAELSHSASRARTLIELIDEVLDSAAGLSSFREARSPIGSELRRNRGRVLKEGRLVARLTQKHPRLPSGALRTGAGDR
ncbi:hypothetical protein [Kribbella soli]|uniref:Uncharacterized protein n=1 Tax=Kribbella soli TaxID=1124743 RepID=A0A4V2LYZ8_9ACTN|nr:hypothetical protein [Kribbella soli]TCC06236.1 hypothetical protein E0H45_30335 [Kribbella soli]